MRSMKLNSSIHKVWFLRAHSQFQNFHYNSKHWPKHVITTNKQINKLIRSRSVRSHFHHPNQHANQNRFRIVCKLCIEYCVITTTSIVVVVTAAAICCLSATIPLPRCQVYISYAPYTLIVFSMRPYHMQCTILYIYSILPYADVQI